MLTPDEALIHLRYIAKEVSPVLFNLCNVVLDDPRFLRGYGAAVDGEHAHHAYKGGLVTHTLEVVKIARRMATDSTYPADVFNNPAPHVSIFKSGGANTAILTVAGIWHDYAKVCDYDCDGKKTEYRKFIRHVAGSYFEFEKHAVAVPVGDRMRIGHCILAHHGRREFGSPVEPQTIEAQMLHYADMLSMLYGEHRDIKDAA